MYTNTKKTKDIIENIQYYYECYDGAKKRQEAQVVEDADSERTVDYDTEACPEDLSSDSPNWKR